MQRSTSSSLPPLPSSLSARLLSTINPQTGACKHHPAVQLCELVDHNTRWIVRRKICSRCGARAPVGVSRRMPGVSVVNPSSSKNDKDRVQSRTTSRSPQPRPLPGRSRSATSTDRPRERSASSSRLKKGEEVIIIKSDGGGERKRTSSIPSRLREREAASNGATDGIHRRYRSVSASKQRILIEDALSSAKAEASAERGYHGGVTRRIPSTNDALVVVPSNGLGSSFHSRALEFTSKALIITAPPPAPRESSKGNAPTASLTAKQDCRDVDKFDESDPFIIIPVINHSDNSLPPPPPPRSQEEMALHMERLKMRQASLRKEYQARRAKMAAVTSSRKTDDAGAAAAVDPPAAADFTSRSHSKDQGLSLTKPDAKRSANHGHRLSTEASGSYRRTVTSPSRSHQATTRGRDSRRKANCNNSKPESTAIVASTTRALPENQSYSYRDTKISKNDKKLSTSQSRSVEKSPPTSKDDEHDKRRSSSHERKHSSKSEGVDHRRRSMSRSKESMRSGDEGHHSDRSRAYSRKSSKEGRSTVTGSTKPESMSSTSSKSNIKIVLSRSMSKEVEESKDSQVLVFQRKKRAHRQGGKRQSKSIDRESRSHRTQPMALIQCSSDEQSHASSISESMCTNEFDVKDRPALLSFTKSGAKQLVTRSKSALEGIGSLNSARRKFQSALIV